MQAKGDCGVVGSDGSIDEWQAASKSDGGKERRGEESGKRDGERADFG